MSQEYKDVIKKCHVKEKELRDKLELLNASPEDLEAVKIFDKLPAYDAKDLEIKRIAFQSLTDIQKQAWEIGFNYAFAIQNREAHEFGEYCNAVKDCTEKYVLMNVRDTIQAYCEKHKSLAKQDLEA